MAEQLDTIRADARVIDLGVDDETRARRLYLDLLKQVLTRLIFPETYRPVDPHKGTLQRALFTPVRKLLDAAGLQLVRRFEYDAERRREGLDWPPDAETMIGINRLDNLELCVSDVIRRGVPGDLIETGVWRGGAAIFMRAVLEAFGDTDRMVWAADSFQGLPKPDPRHQDDVRDAYWRKPVLAASLDEVKANFAKYGLLDDRVRFLPGWFRDTLPSAPIERLAVLRLDGDLYESTMDALEALYPKLSVGGYAIIDDYRIVPGCNRAVDEYRARHGIQEEMHVVDWGCVYWQRER
ncbi:MAG TPA: TylF/MycF family methyltransferase [Actinomycetota bacterium]|nr:TylF/MycF family methyltransferase [Actinomycetota bacterium]